MTTAPVVPSSAAPPQPATLQLTERERQLINDLRRIDFWRAGRTRMVITRWDGTRLVVFDGQQIT